MSRIIKVVIVAFAVGMVLALVACGTDAPSGTSPDAGIDAGPGPDAGLPPCPPDRTGFCTAAGVCTIDGMQCQAPHHGFPHPDAGVDAP